jgi:hypothetical protein
MYVGIAAPPWSGSRAYKPGGLIHVEECRPEQKDRREHEQCDERGRTDRLIAEPV